jgi:hypothetical protein
VLGARLNHCALRLLQEKITELNGLSQAARIGEDLGMSSHTDYPAQHLRGDAVTGITIENVLKPSSAQNVIVGIRAESLD